MICCVEICRQIMVKSDTERGPRKITAERPEVLENFSDKMEGLSKIFIFGKNFASGLLTSIDND